MAANSMLRHLVELAKSSTNAQAAELVILGDPEFRVLAGDTSIGGHQTWTDHVEPGCDIANITGVSPEFQELRTVPITGPSAEPGWIAVAHSNSNGLADDALESLDRVSTLIEERLDRTAERIRLDQLGSVLHSNQEQLKVARDQLAASNTDLEQFAYIAAHELVSPLRSVAIYAEVLESLVPIDETVTSDRARQCADAIRDGVTTMNQQVQYLLEFSRAEATAAKIEVVELRDVVTSALDTLAEPLDEADATVVVGELQTVLGREVPLQSVFANLIKNAVSYRHPDRQLHLEISSVVTDDSCRVSVVDNGVGVDISDRTRVFQLFERAAVDSPGTGIGLALSRRIVEAYGGEIGVDGGATVGSVFWLELPAVPDAA